jgi:hypothetical protein
MTDTAFIKKLLEGANNYWENSKTHGYEYSNTGPNCTGWAIGLLTYAGVHSDVTGKSDDFSGPEWGGGVTVGDGMFDPPDSKKE